VTGTAMGSVAQGTRFFCFVYFAEVRPGALI
jgi:hypothetical protein